jgi:hypothetical protein
MLQVAIAERQDLLRSNASIVERLLVCCVDVSACCISLLRSM